METSVSEPLMTCRNDPIDDVKTGGVSLPRDKSGSKTYIPARRHPVLRRRYHISGFCAEHENLSSRCEGRTRVSGPHEAERTDARHRGGATCISGDDS
jgi:hypothetical protein